MQRLAEGQTNVAKTDKTSVYPHFSRPSLVHGCASTPGAARLPHIWRNEFDPLKGHRKLPLKAANKSSSGEQEPRAPFIAANDLFIKSDDG